MYLYVCCNGFVGLEAVQHVHSEAATMRRVGVSTSHVFGQRAIMRLDGSVQSMSTCTSSLVHRCPLSWPRTHSLRLTPDKGLELYDSRFGTDALEQL